MTPTTGGALEIAACLLNTNVHRLHSLAEDYARFRFRREYYG